MTFGFPTHHRKAYKHYLQYHFQSLLKKVTVENFNRLILRSFNTLNLLGQLEEHILCHNFRYCEQRPHNYGTR